MRWLVVLPVLLFLAVAAGLFVALRSGDPHVLPSALVGHVVPAFSLPPLAGRPADSGLTSDDLKRGEVSLVNVWASWCAPCRVEHPLLMRLAKEGDVALHGISYKDRPEAASQVLQSLGDPFRLVGVDADGRVAIDWGVYGVPETFLVDGAGRILLRHAGEVTPEVLEREFRPAIAAARAGR
ncbi:MAG: DsbE family thiol:disulfide interchange protein [Alphaproteobacteria bacterium]|nr:DsbE family thiol:disulfide interchange protein [Alphaproteobacteria bacterium]